MAKKLSLCTKIAELFSTKVPYPAGPSCKTTPKCTSCADAKRKKTQENERKRKMNICAGLTYLKNNSNIMFIFFICFICFFICHPLLLWQKISRSKMAYPYHSAPAYLALRIALVRAIILLYSITTFLPLCLIMMHLQFSP